VNNGPPPPVSLAGTLHFNVAFQARADKSLSFNMLSSESKQLEMDFELAPNNPIPDYSKNWMTDMQKDFMTDWHEKGHLQDWLTKTAKKVHKYYDENKEQIWHAGQQVASIVKNIAPLILS